MKFNDNNDCRDLPYHLMYSPRDSSRLEKLGSPVTISAGYEIDCSETVPDHCYLVKSGRIACYELSYSGEQRIYNIMLPGSIFLEECVIYSRPCPILFRAIEESELVRIDRCDLIRAFKKDIDIVMDICESLSVKFLSSMEHLRFGPQQSASWKICRLLAIYAMQYGKPADDGSITINEKLSQQMMADILGMNRITVTRKLKELRELNLVSSSGGHFIIHSMKDLEAYMSIISGQE